jgi:hypothetical protein
MTVCIHFKERQYRMAYQVTVDDYTVLNIGGGFKLVDDDTGLAKSTFVFQAGNNLTAYPSLYYDRPKMLVTPVFNIVRKVNEGVLTDVLW